MDKTATITGIERQKETKALVLGVNQLLVCVLHSGVKCVGSGFNKNCSLCIRDFSSTRRHRLCVLPVCVLTVSV